MRWLRYAHRLREHLQILGSVFNTAGVDFHGSELSASPGWPVQVAGGTPVPMLLSDDVEGARTVAAQQLSIYQTIPSYRNVIAREGAASVADLAAIGPEESVVRQLRRYRDAGATDLVISPLDRSAAVDRQALWRLTAAL